MKDISILALFGINTDELFYCDNHIFLIYIEMSIIETEVLKK